MDNRKVEVSLKELKTIINGVIDSAYKLGAISSVANTTNEQNEMLLNQYRKHTMRTLEECFK